MNMVHGTKKNIMNFSEKHIDKQSVVIYNVYRSTSNIYECVTGYAGISLQMVFPEGRLFVLMPFIMRTVHQGKEEFTE